MFLEFINCLNVWDRGSVISKQLDDRAGNSYGEWISGPFSSTKIKIKYNTAPFHCMYSYCFVVVFCLFVSF